MTAPATEPTANQAPAAAAPANGHQAETPEQTIARLQADLTSARAEAGKARTTAKENAANEARNALAQDIGKALGLVVDSADPAELTKQAATAAAEAKAAKVALAVYQAAHEAGADPAALLDSQAFLASAANLDTSNPAALTAAIQQAVAANPRLARDDGSPRLPAPNHAQGTSTAGAAQGTPRDAFAAFMQARLTT